MRNKIIGLLTALVVLFPLFGFQQLEAKRHCRSQFNLSIGMNFVQPRPCYYQETYIVRHQHCGPCYYPAPVYVRPVPVPCYYQEVYVYPAPCYPYGW